MSKPRMTPVEVVAEVEWQYEMGQPAWLAARALGRSLAGLAKTCERQGRADLAAWLYAEHGREVRAS